MQKFKALVLTQHRGNGNYYSPVDWPDQARLRVVKHDDFDLDHLTPAEVAKVVQMGAVDPVFPIGKIKDGQAAEGLYAAQLEIKPGDLNDEQKRAALVSALAQPVTSAVAAEKGK